MMLRFSRYFRLRDNLPVNGNIAQQGVRHAFGPSVHPIIPGRGRERREALPASRCPIVPLPFVATERPGNPA